MEKIRKTSEFKKGWLKPFLEVFCVLALSIIFLSGLAGCAGTAKGTKKSVYRSAQKNDTPVKIPPRAEALVIIRYPAIISADAEHPFYQAFGSNAIGGTVPIEVKLRTDTTRVAQAVIAKTNYYVMTLYKELKAKLPEHTVLLSPHLIDWNEDNGLHSRPMLASEQIPSVLTIDFSVYSYPDVRKIMDSPPLTFGDIVTPLFVVHSDRWVKPATHGLILSSDPLMQTAWGLSTTEAEQKFSGMLQYPNKSWTRPLDFITFLSTRKPAVYNVPTKQISDSRGGTQAVEVYPLEKVQLDPVLIANLVEDFSVDPFAKGFIQGAAERVVQRLGSIDHNRALFFSRQAALQRFDPELANVFLARVNEESVRARLQLAAALVEAEKTFLSGQSDSVFQGTYYGDYGQKMRQMIAAEFGMLDERRRLARIQNMTTALAVAMLAGSVYGTTVSGTVIASALQSITGVLVLGSIWAISSSVKTRAKSGNITEKFMSLMAPDLDRQVDVQMEWLESKEKITARGFAEFRDKTTALYQSRVRSLNTNVDDRCVFRHPAVDASGRWYGQCENGQASGRGYGLAKDQAGNSVEYLGEARSGYAWGTGGMIRNSRGQTGLVYFEGPFNQGLPDGVMAIEKPGQSDQFRKYQAGKDMGKAAESQWIGLKF